MTKKTPEKWLEEEFSHIQILDHDGWRGENAPTWNKKLKKSEFQRRLSECTILLRGGFHARAL